MTEREKMILKEFVKLFSKWRGRFDLQNATQDFADMARDLGETCMKYPSDYLADAMTIAILDTFDNYYKNGFPVDIETPFFTEA